MANTFVLKRKKN